MPSSAQPAGSRSLHTALVGSDRRLERAGFRAASLGPRILRFETAAVAALAVVAQGFEAGRAGAPAAATGQSPIAGARGGEERR